MRALFKVLSIIITLIGMLFLLFSPMTGSVIIGIAVLIWIIADRKKPEQKDAQEPQRISRHPSIDTSHVRENPIIIDLETTGLDRFKDEILSCAIVDKNGTVLFDRMFKPVRRERWPAAEKVNHISPKDVALCSSFAESRDDIQQIIDQHTAIVGYNVEFDLKFLEANGIKQSCPSVDVMARYGWMTDQDASRRHKLTTAADLLGYEWHGDAHTALADAQATLYVYRKTLEDEGLSL